MNAVIVPGLFAGLAPPAANAPSAPAATAATGKTFAEAVTAVQTALQQPGGEADAPPGKPPAASTNPAVPTALALLLAGLIARLQSEGTGAGNGEQQTPLPDRPAGAGVEQSNTNAMEALMGQLLLARMPASPDEVAATAAVLAAMPDARGADLAAAMLQGIGQALASAPGGDGVPGRPALAGGVQALVDAALAAQAAVPDGTPGAIADAARTGAPAPLPALDGGVATNVDAGQALAAALVSVPGGGGSDAPGSAPTARTEAAGGGSAALEATAAAVSTAVPAMTDRPVLPGGESRERDARHRAAEAPLPLTLAGAPLTQGAVLARANAAVNADAPAATPITVQLANTVQSAVLRGEHEVRLVLNPPELGRVQISITETSQGIRVHLQTEQFGARELIERQLPLLHQALAARELRVDRLQVSQAEQSGSAQWAPDSRGSGDGQRQPQGDGTAPEWSPLAALGAGAAQAKAPAPRTATVAAGSIDVMA